MYLPGRIALTFKSPEEAEEYINKQHTSTEVGKELVVTP